MKWTAYVWSLKLSLLADYVDQEVKNRVHVIWIHEDFFFFKKRNSARD